MIAETLSPEDLARVRELFDEVVAQPPGERSAFLERTCAGRPDFLREVTTLLEAPGAGEQMTERVERVIGREAATTIAHAGAPEKLPAHIGEYPVIGRLGEGGMGVVFEAEDPQLGRRIAIKMLPATLSRRAAWLDRLRAEARALAALNHPNIATIYSLEDWQGTAYLTMERIQGTPMSETVARGPLALERTLEVAGRIARALEAAHDAGVVHRDLKPANIMLTDDGAVKVVDFGVAARVEPVGRGGAPASTRAEIAGTPGYMSPEQLRGDLVDARSDVFALGCVLAECLAGKPAIGGMTSEERIQSTLADPLHTVALPEDTPERLRDLVARCVSTDCADRPDTMRAVRQTIESLIEERRVARLLGRNDAPSSANNLPRRLTRFVGRKREMAEIRARADNNALVTLTGVGGCGKSRLAIATATQMLPVASDGAFWVELAAIDDPALVPQAFLTSLGVTEPSPEDPAATLQHRLAPLRALLVVDGCEGVRTAAATVIAGILATAPDVTVLATSREALGVDGESVYVVPPLGAPQAEDRPATAGRDMLPAIQRSEAVALFVDRARLVDPAFEITPDNADHVATLCRHLDGIPLALELAAARLGSLSLADLVRHLDRRFELLVRRTSAPTDRHRTLEAAIDWSYEHLSDPERLLFRRLSVFAGGWTAAAAEQVAADDHLHAWEVLDLLSALVEKSLVVLQVDGRRPGAARYDMLDTVRLFAASRLAQAGEADAMRARHRAYYFSLVVREPLDGKYLVNERLNPQRPTAAELDAELANIRRVLAAQGDAALAITSALDFVTQLAPYLDMRGHWSEARRYLDATISRAADHRSPKLGSAFYWAGDLAKKQADFDEARKLFESGQALGIQLGDDATLADALNGLGNVAEHRKMLIEAQAHYNASLVAARRMDDPYRAAIALGNLGVVAKDQRDYDHAVELYSEALEIFRSFGDDRNAATVFTDIGWMAFYQGDFTTARQRFQQALELRESLGDKSGIAASLSNLAEIELKEGRALAARPALVRALAMRMQLGEQYAIAQSLSALSQVAQRTGDAEQATRLLGAASKIWTRTGAAAHSAHREDVLALTTTLESSLGTVRYAAAWRAGESAVLEDVLREIQSAG